MVACCQPFLYFFVGSVDDVQIKRVALTHGFDLRARKSSVGPLHKPERESYSLIPAVGCTS